MPFLSIAPGHMTRFPERKGTLERVHQFDEPSIGAVNAALAAQRPLLVRGEPGVGKTQLAEAAAIELQRAFVPFTVDARTESRDLLWRFDAVQRLAQAQLYAASNKQWEDVERELAERNFVRPGPLWWAFDATSAKETSRGATPLDQPDNAARAANGWVVLIDEIDKAESDVPNGLLEALGAGQFTSFGYEQSIHVTGVAPLIVITTNEERTLPNAFLRRCLVLTLAVPSEDDALIEYLTERGRAHFGEATSAEVLQEAARQLVKDRKEAAKDPHNPKPGQAEYLDLVRAVIELADGDVARQKALLATVARFTLIKHLGRS
ncbi:MAG: AAA family ATPase [Deltaproteobacteria bacterium]|nr:AAA family ATPase [Deltaproteobacteria bacterium]